MLARLRDLHVVFCVQRGLLELQLADRSSHRDNPRRINDHRCGPDTNSEYHHCDFGDDDDNNNNKSNNTNANNNNAFTDKCHQSYYDSSRNHKSQLNERHFTVDYFGASSDS